MSALVSDILIFAGKNWGNLASVVGLALTIFYARGAKIAATAARLAADSARARIQAVDWVLHLTTALNKVNLALLRFENPNDYASVANICIEIRTDIAVFLKSGVSTVDDDTLRRLKLAPGQFSGIVTAIDKSPLDLDRARIRKVLSVQKEVLTLALHQAKLVATKESYLD